MMFRDFGVTGLVATPSYALYLSEAVKDSGYPMSDYKLRLGILGSEPCTPEMRSQIEQNLQIRVSDNYGLTEIGDQAFRETANTAAACFCRRPFYS